MDDTAAEWGVLTAGLGLVAVAATESGLVSWVSPATTVGPVSARAVAGVGFLAAVLAFSLARHGTVTSRQSGLGAAAASAVAVLATLAAFFGPTFQAGGETAIGAGPYLAVLIGAVSVALGRALATGVPTDRLYTVARALSVATSAPTT